MTADTDIEPALDHGRRLHSRVAVAVLGALAFIAVVALMLFDRFGVRRAGELAHVGFGMPFNWVSQHKSIDPPLPSVASFASPWENPTSVDILALLVDVLLVGVLLAAAWGAVGLVRSKRSAK